MAPQLVVAEQSLIDKILRQDEGNGADALAVVNAARSKKKLPSIVVTQCVANDSCVMSALACVCVRVRIRGVLREHLLIPKQDVLLHGFCAQLAS